MAQNIQLFGPRGGFLTHQLIITWNKLITDKYYDEAKMRTRQKCVATDTWRSLGCRTTPLEHWSRRKPTVEPRWAKQQTKKLRPKPTKINSFMSGPSLSLYFMIVKLLLWLWQSLRLRYDCEVLLLLSFIYDCEVLLLLSFIFDLSLVNWFVIIRGNMILLIKNFHLETIF